MKGGVLAFAALAAATIAGLALAGGVAGAPKQNCATPVYQNGLELVFGRASSRAGADKIAARATGAGFKGMGTVQESCSVFKAVLRGIELYDQAVGVQSEARRVHMTPTIECLVAQEIGQFQVIFGTRPTTEELGDVIQRANSFGYKGLKTKTAPCGGYQAYITGFKDMPAAAAYAKDASDRTGLKVVAIKA